MASKAEWIEGFDGGMTRLADVYNFGFMRSPQDEKSLGLWKKGDYLVLACVRGSTQSCILSVCESAEDAKSQLLSIRCALNKDVPEAVIRYGYYSVLGDANK